MSPQTKSDFSLLPGPFQGPDWPARYARQARECWHCGQRKMAQRFLAGLSAAHRIREAGWLVALTRSHEDRWRGYLPVSHLVKLESARLP